MKYGTTNGSEADLTVDISKLLLYAIAQLIWCSYFIQKTTIFNPTDVLVYFYFYSKSTIILKWPKIIKLAPKASHNTWVWSEQPGYQREHERINQHDQRQPLKLTIIPSSCVLFLLFLFLRNTLKHSEKIQSVSKHSEKIQRVWQTL